MKLFPRLFGRKNKKSVFPASAPASSPKIHSPHFVRFNVAGVTFDNEDGENRQIIIYKIKYAKPPFQDSANLAAEINKVSYNGELAYEVRVNGVLVGYVPREKIKEVQEAIKHQDAAISALDVCGGSGGYSYGLLVVIKYSE